MMTQFDFSKSHSSSPFWKDPKVREFGFSQPESIVEIVSPLDAPLSRKFESSVVMYMGRRGKGKTLGMTCMTYFEYEEYCRPQCHSKSIYSNYWMHWADHVDPALLERLNTFTIRDAYACVDEIASQVAGRKSLRSDNVDFAQLLVQLRKREMEMAFATQFPQTVDYQVLIQTDLFLEVEGYNFNYWGMPEAINVKVYDWWGQWTGNNWRKRWPPQPEDVDDEFDIIITDPKAMGASYLSNQSIPPAWSKNKHQIIVNEWGDLLNETDYKRGEELTEEAVEFLNAEPAVQTKKIIDIDSELVRIGPHIDDLLRTQPNRFKNADDVREMMRREGWDFMTVNGQEFAKKT